MQINSVNVQNSLNSSVNIKTINNQNILTSGNYDVPVLGSIKICNIIPRTGTEVVVRNVNTITYSSLIPARSFSTNGILNFTCRLEKIGANTTPTWNVRVYTNTSNSLTGAIQIASLSNSAGSILFSQSIRYFRLRDGNIYFFTINTQTTTDINATTIAEGSTTFNLAVDNYIIVAIQKGGATDTPDIFRGVFLKLVGYE